jgi:hypothetical protein
LRVEEGDLSDFRVQRENLDSRIVRGGKNNFLFLLATPKHDPLQKSARGGCRLCFCVASLSSFSSLKKQKIINLFGDYSFNFIHFYTNLCFPLPIRAVPVKKL